MTVCDYLVGYFFKFLKFTAETRRAINKKFHKIEYTTDNRDYAVVPSVFITVFTPTDHH